jgi:DNA-binding NtrC family response regulator
MRSFDDANGNGYHLENAMRQGVEALKEGAFTLLRAAELIETSLSRDARNQINFYGEVRRFEIDLIRFALKETDGNQARAAHFLGLKKTTLNHKVKQYNIDMHGSVNLQPPLENLEELSGQEAP